MKKALVILSLFCVAFWTQGQNNLLFFNFEHVNQNLLVNPSNPHPYRFVIGMPGVSGVSMHFRNTFFKAGDVLNDNTGNENLENVIRNMSGSERLSFYESADLIYAGFGIKSGYVSFGIQQEANLTTLLPAQLFQFLYFGNEDAENQNIFFTKDDFDIEATIQINYHVGYQHWLLDSTLIVGGRFKYISGTANARFSKFNMGLQSDFFEWNINTDITLETSGYDYIDDFGNFNPIEQINSGNPGFGVDLGATYLLPKMKISAAVLNMGKITWNKRLKHYQSQGDFTYDGIELDPEDPDFDFDPILDSLEEALGFKEITPYSYSSKLPARYMFSYEYQVHPKHAFGVTYQGTNWNGKFYNNFGVNYVGRWHKRINFILGYGRLAGGLNNFGAGISAALGPIQLYLMSDNIWGVVKPAELSATNFRIGLNLVFFDLKPKEPKEEELKNPISE